MEARTFIIINVKTNLPVLEESTGLPVEFETPALANAAARSLASVVYESVGLSRPWGSYGFTWQQGFTNDHYRVKPVTSDEGETNEAV